MATLTVGSTSPMSGVRGMVYRDKIYGHVVAVATYQPHANLVTVRMHRPLGEMYSCRSLTEAADALRSMLRLAGYDRLIRI